MNIDPNKSHGIVPPINSTSKSSPIKRCAENAIERAPELQVAKKIHLTGGMGDPATSKKIAQLTARLKLNPDTWHTLVNGDLSESGSSTSRSTLDPADTRSTASDSSVSSKEEQEDLFKQIYKCSSSRQQKALLETLEKITDSSILMRLKRNLDKIPNEKRPYLSQINNHLESMIPLEMIKKYLSETLKQNPDRFASLLQPEKSEPFIRIYLEALKETPLGGRFKELKIKAFTEHIKYLTEKIKNGSLKKEDIFIPSQEQLNGLILSRYGVARNFAAAIRSNPTQLLKGEVERWHAACEQLGADESFYILSQAKKNYS